LNQDILVAIVWLLPVDWLVGWMWLFTV